jgi:hypothetical protein
VHDGSVILYRSTLDGGVNVPIRRSAELERIRHELISQFSGSFGVREFMAHFD